MTPPGPGRILACLLAAALALAAAALAPTGCSRPAPRATACVWLMGRDEPTFDPDGPPDPWRWALERMLTRGLVEEDSTGRIVPAAAERFELSPDSLTFTFHLRPGLRFTDGSPCRSADFRRALEGGLNRRDHATRAWLLAAVRGVDRVRAGKPLPEIGIETPDDGTLMIRLTRPDTLFLRRLALPGVGDAWTGRTAGSWNESRGLGPYRVAGAEPGRRLTLVRARTAAGTAAGADSVTVRFGLPVGRARSLMRAGAPDLVWPIPAGLLSETLPGGYRWTARPAAPQRRLLLVMRADLPPTSKLAARHALAHGLNRGELQGSLGPLGQELAVWLKGAERFEFPSLDPGEVQRWMEQGRLGRSFHVVMAYDPEGPAGMAARMLQGEWARYAIYVELLPLRGRRLTTELLEGRAHLLLVDAQSPLEDAAAELVSLVMPLRGPAVGSFRTGWRTREFDAWLAPRRAGSPLPVVEAQRRLEEELIVLPLVRLPWIWVERAGGAGAPFHPHFGPGCPAPAAAAR
jgi:ABC-type transport system substrate-binding protein